MPPRNFDNTRERSAGVATPAGFNLESEHEAPLSEGNAPVQVKLMNGYVAEIPDPDQPDDNGGIAQVFFVNVRDKQGAELGLHVLKRAPHGGAVGTHLLREIALARWASTRCLERYGKSLVAPGITYGQDDQYQYGLHKLVSGWTLAQHIECGTRLPVFSIVRDLLRAAVAMEDAPAPSSTFGSAFRRLGSIIHHDIKPGNVIYGPEGTVLIDLNIAHGQFEQDYAPAHARGTPVYLAPEQCDGDKQDPRSTQNQIARTAIQVLTHGAYARVLRGSHKVIMRRTAQGEDIAHIKSLMAHKGIPDAEQGLLLRALEPDPRDRYPNSQAMLEAVERHLCEDTRAPRVRSLLRRLS